MQFDTWIHGEDAIRIMQEHSWSKWRETEWPGWYLEYLFSTFLNGQCTDRIVYQGNEAKKKDALDFDLFFPVHQFYGDLKASDIGKKESPGNDETTLMKAINRYDRFWYIIYEHDTVKDKDCGNTVAKFR